MINLALLLADFPPVNLLNQPVLVADRENKRTVKMLAASVSIQAELLQACPDLRAVLAVFVRQGQPKRSIGEADLKHLQSFFAADAA